MFPVLHILTLSLAPLLLQTESDADTLLAIFGEDKQLNGWSLQNNIRHYSSGGWVEDYPGMVQVFSEYGLQEFICLDFKSENDQVIAAVIHKLADNEGAYGLFSVSHSNGGNTAGYGDEAYENLRSVHFWKGRYYAKVSAETDDDFVRGGLSSVASYINNKIIDKGERPGIIEILPEEGFVTEKTRYYRGSAGMHLNLPFGHEDINGFIEGVSSDFGTHQLLLFEYETVDLKNTWFHKLRKNLDNNKRYNMADGNCNNLCYVDQEGNKLIFGSHSRYIMGFVGKELAIQPEIFERIEDAIEKYHPENEGALNGLRN